MHVNHDEYYRDRLTERDLCYDFPGDEILIDGLHAMQCHFWNNNVQVDIPVVRVMNAAHFLAAYMFSTTCSGDRNEYDALAYGSIGHDQKLISVTMIVLAAMLARTEGFRAQNCRDVILANRDTDFYEGLTLYDRFLRSAEKRFEEESFLIDIPALVAQNQAKDAIIAQQQEQIVKLKFTLTTMENQLTQVNIGTQNIIGTQYNITYAAPNTAASAPDVTAQTVQETIAEQDMFKYIHVAVTDERERIRIHKMVCNIVRLPKIKMICDELYRLIKQEKVLATIKPEAMLAELRRMGMSSADTPGFSDQNFYSNYKA